MKVQILHQTIGPSRISKFKIEGGSYGNGPILNASNKIKYEFVFFWVLKLEILYYFINCIIVLIYYYFKSLNYIFKIYLSVAKYSK